MALLAAQDPRQATPAELASATGTATVAVSAPAPQEPGQFFTIGAGIQGLGPVQPFGYYSISQHITTGTYATEINEYARLKGGGVATCARAGISKVLWTVSVVALGIVGDAGACEAATGSAGGAVAERGFATVRFGKTRWAFVATAENLKIAGTGQQAVITIGFGFGI